MSLEIIPLPEELLSRAAEFFASRFKLQRQAVPALPGSFADPAPTANRLGSLIESQHALAAVEHGCILGYLGWYLVDDFRGAGRKAAYIPVWGHAAVAERQNAVYAALYRAAAEAWTAAGCQVHAISLLANDPAVQTTWFWFGFGLAVVDAIRGMQLLNPPLSPRLSIHQARVEDAETLAVLEKEHWQHYTEPPIYMAAQEPTSADGFREFLQQPHNNVWWAQAGGDAVGFMRFEGQSHGASEVVQSEATIAITGAYTRPRFRGLGAAPALLAEALRHYSAQGFERCAVDFESFNPEAARFWTKYFDPVVYSLMRRPEMV